MAQGGGVAYGRTWLDSNNLEGLIQALRREYPQSDLTILIDNLKGIHDICKKSKLKSGQKSEFIPKFISSFPKIEGIIHMVQNISQKLNQIQGNEDMKVKRLKQENDMQIRQLKQKIELEIQQLRQQVQLKELEIAQIMTRNSEWDRSRTEYETLINILKEENTKQKRKYDTEIAELRKHLENAYQENTVQQVESIQTMENLGTRHSTMSSFDINNERAKVYNIIEQFNVDASAVAVTSEYQRICTDIWHTAKSEMDIMCSGLEEKQRVCILCDIFIESEKSSTSLHEKFVRNLLRIVTTESTNGSNSCSTDGIKILINETMKLCIGENHISELVQTTKNSIKSKYGCQTNSAYLGCQAFTTFLESCTKLTWKMRVQNPPMTFKQPGIQKRIDENVQEAFWGSSDVKNPQSYVQYYVYPCMYYGDEVKTKGMVYLNTTLTW